MSNRPLGFASRVSYWAIDTWGGNNSVLGVERINGSMLTTFDVWNAAEQVNGDGILICKRGRPLPSMLKIHRQSSLLMSHRDSVI